MKVSFRPGTRAATAYVKRRTSFEDRFTPEPNTGCWLWMAGMSTQGYGSVVPCADNGNTTRAHRESWFRYRGPIPDGLHVLHKCDIPWCVNPDHLFLGTIKDNSDDKVSKGRHHRMPGRKNGRAKLTEEQVRYIRSSSESNISLGKRFGVSNPAISFIKRGVHWKDVK